MATNKKKLLITQSMSKVGWDLFNGAGRHRGGAVPEHDHDGGFPGAARDSTRPSTAWRWA